MIRKTLTFFSSFGTANILFSSILYYYFTFYLINTIYCSRTVVIIFLLAQLITQHTLLLFLLIFSVVFFFTWPRYKSENTTNEFFLFFLRKRVKIRNFNQAIPDFWLSNCKKFILESCESWSISIECGGGNRNTIIFFLNKLFVYLFIYSYMKKHL